MKKTSWMLSAVAASAVLMGCAQTGPAHTSGMTESQAMALQAHRWTLVQAKTADGSNDPLWAGADPRTVRAMHLDFHADRSLNVSGLCNGMRGIYELKADQMRVSRLASTMKMCSDSSLMQLERSVGVKLPTLQNWQLTSGAQPVLKLRFADGAQWSLQGQRTYESLYGAPQRIFVEVAPKKVPCTHGASGPTQCLQLRDVTYNAQGIKQGVGPWYAYYDEIEGFTHVEGTRQVLRLNRYTRTNPPADASRFVDVLDLMVETGPAK